MIRTKQIIPKPIIQVMDKYSDESNFVVHISKNHMELFSDEILDSKDELEKYIHNLFLKFTNVKVQKVEEDDNKFPDLNNVFVVVKKEADFLNAIKEVLWRLNNTPSTAKKILMHIAKVDSDGNLSLISENDYFITNKAFSLGSFNREIICSKLPLKTGKSVYLYKNPTDKRKGFYYEGNLLSLKELSNINGVPVITIQTRIKKGIKIENAIKK